MASSRGYFDLQKGSRPSISQIQSKNPATPQTPSRAISSVFPSPSASFRTEEEALVLEIGSRFLRVGFAGETAPRRVFSFGPEEQRRAADYRRWGANHQPFRRKRRRFEAWGEAHELWSMDLRRVDLGLVGDKIERALREAYTKYLILGSMPKKLLLALPSELPHQLLDTVLYALFTYFQHPNITLLPTPVLSMAATGLRSALVIDIGWDETTITSISEYREVARRRSIRAGKLLTLEMARLLEREITPRRRGEETHLSYLDDEALPEMISFEESEEVLMRLGWCRKYKEAMGLRDGKQAAWTEPTSSSSATQSHTLFAISEDEEEVFQDASEHTAPDPTMSIHLKSTNPPTSCQIPFSAFAEPAESALFAPHITRAKMDDHELPLPLLAYRALLSLPIDVRGLCMARIIVVGGVSKIPGVKKRIIDELAALVQERGWDPVWGRASNGRRKALAELSDQRRCNVSLSSTAKSGDYTDDFSVGTPTHIPPAFAEQEPDPIEQKLRRLENKGGKPHIQGRIRGIESGGAWVGASLLGSLKVKGIVEAEREKFLQHGLAGAVKEGEIMQRQSMTVGGTRTTGVNERPQWTLGLWA
ncbi:MAG: hypothetical protein M1835_003840 [Candelina submexicana]|nr:MAG: hypothetical protein M1835_003840 [Candelina submexicana]